MKHIPFSYLNSYYKNFNVTSKLNEDIPYESFEAMFVNAMVTGEIQKEEFKSLQYRLLKIKYESEFKKWVENMFHYKEGDGKSMEMYFTEKNFLRFVYDYNEFLKNEALEEAKQWALKKARIIESFNPIAKNELIERLKASDKELAEIIFSDKMPLFDKAEKWLIANGFISKDKIWVHRHKDIIWALVQRLEWEGEENPNNPNNKSYFFKDAAFEYSELDQNRYRTIKGIFERRYKTDFTAQFYGEGRIRGNKKISLFENFVTT